MEYYKPESKEENYANVIFLKENFWNIINGQIWNFNQMEYRYMNASYYNWLLANNLVNPYMNYGVEMLNFAFSVFGFASDTYERIAYALDCWHRAKDKKLQNRKASNSEFSQAVEMLKTKNKIDRKDVPVVLNFRLERNFATHYGRIQFVKYIFNNANVIYNLICVTCDQLKSLEIDEDNFIKFYNAQYDFIKDIREALNDFVISNSEIA